MPNYLYGKRRANGVDAHTILQNAVFTYSSHTRAMRNSFRARSTTTTNDDVEITKNATTNKRLGNR